MRACRVELGRAYHKLGKREAAWRELEAAILLDQEDINAYLQKVSLIVVFFGDFFWLCMSGMLTVSTLTYQHPSVYTRINASHR